MDFRCDGNVKVVRELQLKKDSSPIDSSSTAAVKLISFNLWHRSKAPFAIEYRWDGKFTCLSAAHRANASSSILSRATASLKSTNFNP